jgi:undecaprenyl diphosphate synthase
MSYREKIDDSRVPQHVAIIMDGNGRWAKMRGHERSFGHQAGAETVHVIAETAARLGVKYLTLYTFSTENWNRPKEEVEALMNLLFDSIEEETLMKNNIRFRMVGDCDRLPEFVLTRLRECERTSAGNTRMSLVLALSYSSEWELVETTKRIANDVKAGKLNAEDITADTIQQNLATAFMPNPDLLIRTGGEFRLSNFLLWQCAYTEFYFCDTYWPDFREEAFWKAIYEFQQRERRYGKTSEQIENKEQ